MTSFRTFIASLFVALLAVSMTAQAQTPDTDDESLLLRGSNRALIFSLDELSLDGVNGGVGMRWYMSPNVALRGTFNLGIESTEDITEESDDSGLNAFQSGITALVEWHTRSLRRVSPYMASGFGVGVEAYSQTIDLGPNDPIRRQRIKGSFVDFSIGAGFGVEVYLSRSITLSGEHLFEADIRTGSEERRTFFEEGQGEDFMEKRRLRTFTFGTGTSSLIVSIFF